MHGENFFVPLLSIEIATYPKGSQRCKVVACGCVCNEKERLLVRVGFEVQNDFATIWQRLFGFGPLGGHIDGKFAILIFVWSQWCRYSILRNRKGRIEQ